jgi:hypothetical protein
MRRIYANTDEYASGSGDASGKTGVGIRPLAFDVVRLESAKYYLGPVFPR